MATSASIKDQETSQGGLNPEKRTWQFETFTIDLMMGIFAYACACLWLCSFFLTEITPFYCISGYPRNVLLLVYVLLSALFFFAVMFFSDYLSGSGKFRMPLMMIVAAVLYEAAFFTVVDVVFAALVTALLFQNLHAFLARFTQIGFYVGLAAIACGAGIAVMVYLTPMATFVLIQILPVVSIAILSLIARSAKEEIPFVSKEESKSRYTYSASTTTTMILDGAFLGLSLFLVGQMGTLPGNLRFLIAAGIVALVGMLSLLDTSRTILSERIMLKSYSVRVAPFLLILPFATGIGIDICSYALLALLLCNIVMVVCASTERVRFNQLSSYYAFGQTLFLVFLGLAIGWLLGRAALQFQDVTAMKAIVFYVPLFAMIVFSSFLFEDNYPAESELEVSIDEDDRESTRPWKSAIAYIEETYGLSPRQSEVFELLARGRNCEYIKDEFCISRATAKAHIYSIYRKVDIHSQQELINLVEDIMQNRRPASGSAAPKEAKPSRRG